MVQKSGQIRFTTTWLKKLIEFQGDVIGCEGRRQNAVTVGKKGLKEGGISLHLRNMWKVKKKFRNYLKGYNTRGFGKA